FQAFGACCDDILHVEHIEQVAAHTPDNACCARGAKHDNRNPKMLQQVKHLAQTPGLVQILVGEEATQCGDIKDKVGDEHQDQGQQKIGDRQADKAQQGEKVVAQGIFMGGGIDSDWNSHG